MSYILYLKLLHVIVVRERWRAVNASSARTQPGKEEEGVDDDGGGDEHGLTRNGCTKTDEEEKEEHAGDCEWNGCDCDDDVRVDDDQRERCCREWKHCSLSSASDVCEKQESGHLEESPTYVQSYLRMRT